MRALLGRLLKAALAEADPRQAVRRAVARTARGILLGRRRYDLRGGGTITVVGAGKAASRMAAALESRLGSRLSGGLVVVKDGYRSATRVVRVTEAGHPVPDRRGQQAAERLLAHASRLSAHDLLLVVLSGGASSLLPLPPPGLTLADEQRTTRLLLRSGAAIHEINAVRKHLSGIKGGQLAAATPARVVTLILSDVIGDDLSVIGSGPTAPDPTTFADACAVLRRFRLWSRVPARVRRHLLAGTQGRIPDTPKPGSPVFRRVRHLIVGNNRLAVEAVAREARRAGLHLDRSRSALRGEAREAGRLFARLARRIRTSGSPVRPPACVLAAGEDTGWRAQEFALAAALGIAGLPNVWIAGFGTDGTDGPTEAAGAVVDGDTLARARARGLDAARYLRRNDAYRFFQQAGGHIVTGPTGTNVNDLYLLIVL